MANLSVEFSETLEDDVTALDAALAAGLERPLLLWGHPGISRAACVERAARKAGLPFRSISAEQFEGFDGFRDVSDSGHFRAVTLEGFLARGDRADPASFTLERKEVLYIRGLNITPTRLIQSVFVQLVQEHKLLNNPLPDGVRIVASVFPSDEAAGKVLLGQRLLSTWEAIPDRAPLQYPVYSLPEVALEHSDHWAMLPSLPRFVSLCRESGAAEEVTRFLARYAERDLGGATAALHASLIRESEPLQQQPSARAFQDLGSLLAERLPYFSSCAVRDALRVATTFAGFQGWLYHTMREWDPDMWIGADSSLTVRGESVAGSFWLRHLTEQISAGEARIGVEDLLTYAAYERSSLAMWASQELGDDLGEELVHSMTISEAEVAHLAE